MSTWNLIWISDGQCLFLLQHVGQHVAFMWLVASRVEVLANRIWRALNMLGFQVMFFDARFGVVLGSFEQNFYKTSRSWMIWMILCESTRPWALENCTPERGPWSLVTLSSGHLWPYYPRSLATLLSGHLRPYPFNNSHPPAFHHTIVSILLLYLNFPPLRSTIPLSPFYFFI